MLSQQEGDWFIMADIYICKIRINNSVVPNFLMEVDHTLYLRPYKIWATWVEFRTSNGSSNVSVCCDLIQSRLTCVRLVVDIPAVITSLSQHRQNHVRFKY